MMRLNSTARRFGTRMLFSHSPSFIASEQPIRHFSQSRFAAVNAKLIKELRTKTEGVSISECKKALEAVEGDVEKALEWLKEQGAETKTKSGRVTVEGYVTAKSNNHTGILFELNSETDFVSRGEAFMELTKECTDSLFEHSKKLSDNGQQVIEWSPEQVSEIETVNSSEFKTIGEAISSLMFKVRENITVRRAVTFNSEQGVVGTYEHPGGRICSMVRIETDSSEKDSLKRLADDLAAHVVGYNPKYIRRSDVDVLTLEEAQNNHPQGPDKFDEDKFFQETTFMDQDAGDMSDYPFEVCIGALLEAKASKMKCRDIRVTSIARFERGIESDDYVKNSL